MQIIDEYNTLKNSSPEVVYKDKSSKFIGYAFPISSENEVVSIITKLKEEHHKARHWCFAYRLGIENVKYRVNDDGEPNNSAGQPIYGQIQSFELTDVLIVVVRYFGGIKLGVGGLIHAYKTAAKLALESSVIEKRTVDVHFLLFFEYPDMNKIMRLIKEKNMVIIRQDMHMNCKIEVSVRKKEAGKIKKMLDELRGVEVKMIN